MTTARNDRFAQSYELRGWAAMCGSNVLLGSKEGGNLSPAAIKMA
jgi:hypothetical protein